MADNGRHQRVTVLLNKAELRTVRADAKKAGMTVSAYIRWMVFHNRKEEQQ